MGFYRVRSDLTIDVDDLLVRVRALNPEAIVAVAYFGFPVQPEAAEALQQLRARCRVVEDCVHGSLLEFATPVVGRVGDFVVTAFRKYLPLPDGGVVTGSAASDLPELSPSRDRQVARRALSRALRGSFPDGAPSAVEDAYVALEDAAERALTRQCPLEATSNLSARILAGLDLGAAAARRRINYGALLKAFDDPLFQAIGRPLKPELPASVSPLTFPLVVVPRHRDAFRASLRQERVFAPVHWPLPPEVDRHEFPDAELMSRSIIGLPVDQRYTPEDMSVLLDRVRRAWRRIV